jgi:hypothetical protein
MAIINEYDEFRINTRLKPPGFSLISDEIGDVFRT